MNKKILIQIISFFLILGFINLVSATPAVTPSTLTVSASTNKSKYYRYEMVYITVTVTSNGNPVEGIVVGVQVNDPDGFAVYGDQGTTDSNGKVTFHFRLNPDAKYGWYDVTATVTGGVGTTKFEVIPRPPPVGGRIGEVNKLELLAIFVANNLGIILLLSIIVITAYLIILKISRKK